MIARLRRFIRDHAATVRGLRQANQALHNDVETLDQAFQAELERSRELRAELRNSRKMLEDQCASRKTLRQNIEALKSEVFALRKELSQLREGQRQTA